MRKRKEMDLNQQEDGVHVLNLNLDDPDVIQGLGLSQEQLDSLKAGGTATISVSSASSNSDQKDTTSEQPSEEPNSSSSPSSTDQKDKDPDYIPEGDSNLDDFQTAPPLPQKGHGMAK
jgi:hypothetical protein